MEIILVLAVLFLIGWCHAVILRCKHGSAYNKYVFLTALLVYIAGNYIQSQTFDNKTVFSLIFAIYSLIAIPYHLWLMIYTTKQKKSAKE